MRKYAVIATIVAALILTFTGFASANHVSAGYLSRNGQMVLTLGGRYDIRNGHAIEGEYSLMPGGFDVAARYKMPLYRNTVNLGPVVEGRIEGKHVYANPFVGAGIYAERLGVNGLGLHGDLVFRQSLDSHEAGLVAGMGARMALTDPLFLSVDASMGLTGGVAGTEVAFGVGYAF